MNKIFSWISKKLNLLNQVLSNDDSFEMKIDFCDEDCAADSILQEDDKSEINDDSFKDSANSSIIGDSNDVSSEVLDDISVQVLKGRN